jgi:hypothetical protein
MTAKGRNRAREQRFDALPLCNLPGDLSRHSLVR